MHVEKWSEPEPFGGDDLQGHMCKSSRPTVNIEAAAAGLERLQTEQMQQDRRASLEISLYIRNDVWI